MKTFLLAFFPLFVAIDVLVLVPIFLQFTEDLDAQARKRLITQATFTALGVAMLFLFTGRLLFRFLGITESDFRIAGGLLLLLVSIRDLLSPGIKLRRKPDGDVGVVPLGIPMIMGPAALTTILISIDAYGMGLTLASLTANLVIVWVVFRSAHLLQRLMGKSGSIAFARVMAIFLAAIAIMMIRVGLTNTFPNLFR